MKKTVALGVAGVLVWMVGLLGQMGMVRRQALTAPVAWAEEVVARQRAAFELIIEDLNRPFKDACEKTRPETAGKESLRSP